MPEKWLRPWINLSSGFISEAVHDFSIVDRLWFLHLGLAKPEVETWFTQIHLGNLIGGAVSDSTSFSPKLDVKRATK